MRACKHCLLGRCWYCLQCCGFPGRCHKCGQASNRENLNNRTSAVLEFPASGAWLFCAASITRKRKQPAEDRALKGQYGEDDGLGICWRTRSSLDGSILICRSGLRNCCHSAAVSSFLILARVCRASRLSALASFASRRHAFTRSIFPPSPAASIRASAFMACASPLPAASAYHVLAFFAS